jgi:hypothetical protein
LFSKRIAQLSDLAAIALKDFTRPQLSNFCEADNAPLNFTTYRLKQRGGGA